MTVFDYMINIYECLIMTLFLHTWHSENRDHVLIKAIIYFSSEFAFITFINQFSSTESILFIVDVLLSFIYVFTISELDWNIALMISVLPTLIFGISNSLFQMSLTLMFHQNYTELTSMYHIPLLVIINVIHGVLFYCIQKGLHSFKVSLKTFDCFLVFIILLICIMIVNCIHSVLFAKLDTTFFLMTALISSILLSVLVVIVMIRINKQSSEALEKEHQTQMLMHDQMTAEKRMEAEQQLYKLTHDVKHFMSLIDSNYFQDKSELKERSEAIKKEIGTTISTISTPSNPISFVLNLKREEAEKKGIDFKCSVNMTRGIDMDDADLYLVMSNVLDNAIKHIGIYKKIEVIIHEINDMCLIEVTNSIDHYAETDENSLSLHGYGIATINRVMDRYDYAVHYSHTDMMFIVKMLFNCRTDD